MPRCAALVPAAPLAALVYLAACGGPGGPVPASLVYRVPDPNPASYAFSDTASYVVEAGPMGPMEVSTVQDGVADILFEEAGTAFRASVRFPRFRAAFRTPGQGAMEVDEGAIGGAFGVDLSPRGTVEVVDTPSLDPALLAITGPVSMVRPLFVPLPGAVRQPDATWVDTLTTMEESGETRSRSISVITSTLAGDTVVAGSRLVRIRTRAETTLQVTGRAGGVELEQRIRGVTEGVVLWDAALGLLVRRTEGGTLEGTLELPGLGVDAVPVRGRVDRSVTLRR